MQRQRRNQSGNVLRCVWAPRSVVKGDLQPALMGLNGNVKGYKTNVLNIMGYQKECNRDIIE